jgi:ferredoxin
VVAVKVRVDADLCVGHGRCYVLAPDVFASDDFGHCEIVAPEVDGARAEQARIGAENCPERAITLEP